MFTMGQVKVLERSIQIKQGIPETNTEPRETAVEHWMSSHSRGVGILATASVTSVASKILETFMGEFEQLIRHVVEKMDASYLQHLNRSP